MLRPTHKKNMNGRCSNVKTYMWVSVVIIGIFVGIIPWLVRSIVRTVEDSSKGESNWEVDWFDYFLFVLIFIFVALVGIAYICRCPQDIIFVATKRGEGTTGYTYSDDGPGIWTTVENSGAKVVGSNPSDPYSLSYLK